MKPHIRKVTGHVFFAGGFICKAVGSEIYGSGATIPEAYKAWQRCSHVLVAGRRLTPPPPPTTEPERPRRHNWLPLWAVLVVACVLASLAFSRSAHAYDLQKCEWLSNQAYSQAWQRDAGVTLPQLKILIRRSDERQEVQTGLIALSRYVYSHREMSPDDLADDILSNCRSYDQ